MRPIEFAGTPQGVLAGWPGDRPLALLWSAGTTGTDPGARWSRWTVFAEPRGCVLVRSRPNGTRHVEWSGPPLPGIEPGKARDVMAEVDRCLAATAVPRGARADDEPPFVGGWIGYFGYGLGRLIEPAAGHPRPPNDDRYWPELVLHRCPAAYVHDGLLGRWWVVGDEHDIDSLPAPTATGGAALPPPEPGYHLGEFASGMGRESYERAVGRALEYIRDGDCYQVNLAHRLSGTFSGSARRMFGTLAAGAGPWYGGYVETPDKAGARRVLVSASPELLLELDGASGRVVTRPMKGTRTLAAGPGALRDSEKDRAELAMIVDLMRNDLGRVCRFGTVRVDDPRAIEPHGGSVWQGVASVSGVLREGVRFGELMRATFPGGSVTGVPKIRAMQIIEELEPVARGPYCGAFGFISDCGNGALAMSIRTALLSGRAGAGPRDMIADGVLDYPVGAGIVADSVPALEWEETLDKAAVLAALGPTRRGVP